MSSVLAGWGGNSRNFLGLDVTLVISCILGIHLRFLNFLEINIQPMIRKKSRKNGRKKIVEGKIQENVKKI